tara:strand:+ start:11804 stop:12721 length:918 start_codon:yes stop_codon:yes gene_type:complete
MGIGSDIMKVVYGHTDSLYVEIDNIKSAKKIVKKLNKHVRKSFPNVMKLPNHPINLEFEKFYQSLGVGITKNRNAGLINWKDGKYLDEPEFVMTGFTAKRISQTQLAKEIQLTILKMWVNGDTELKIVNYLHEKYMEVLNGKISLSQITKRTRFRENRFKVQCTNCKKNSWPSTMSLNDLIKVKRMPCCNSPNYLTLEGKRPSIKEGVEGVLFYNTHNPIPIQDSYLFLRVKDLTKTYIHPITRKSIVPHYVSGLNENDFVDYTPNWDFYAETIVKKALPIFNAMGWDTFQIIKDRNQRDLEEWF